MEHKCCSCCSNHSAQSTDTPCTATVKTGIKEYGNLLLSALLLATGMVMDALGTGFFREGAVSLVWYAIAYLPVGLPVLREVWENGRRGDVFNEFTLMSIATFGAFYIGEYPEGVAVMLFYSLGELLQERAVSKARRSIRALLDVRPETATVLRNGQAVNENPYCVQVGEVIEVKVGERVPLDGILLTDPADFNTAALTGESLPCHIQQGEEVLSGMIAVDRMVRLQVSKPFAQSALSRILTLVQDAAERKAPAELFIRKFARIYTPAVTGLALLIVLIPWLWSLGVPQFTFSFHEWLYRALVFLVVSCPCALVVSIPLGYFGGIGAASRLGILFKGGNYLDAISQTDTVVFDKTGTLTRGHFEVQTCLPATGTPAKRLIQLIASAEQHSTHPLANAITVYATKQGISLLPATGITETGGYGLEACIGGQRILVGNERLLAGRGISLPPLAGLSETCATPVHCAADDTYIGSLLLADCPKEDAKQAIDALKTLNINNIQILSGDKQTIVTNFARQLGLTEAYGELLPEGKVQHLEKLRKDPKRRIVFVGDGINDAPVLALSHVGIAMGSLGSDAAIETADVVIQTDQPSKVATAIRAGRQTRRIVWQNIALALGIKLLVLLLGAIGLANLWEAVFADVGVALLAVMNAIRVQKLIK